MDPKLSNLDPKLQDAYNRVMGSTPNGNNPPVPGQSPAPAQDPAAAPPPMPQAPIQPPAPEPTPPPVSAETQAMPPAPTEPPKAPDPMPTPTNNPSGSIPGVNTTMAFNAEDSHKNVGTTPVKKGGLHMMPLVIGLGILVLLVVYTFVWIILFNVQIPFLPQL